MGRTKGRYNEEFPPGTTVRIAGEPELQRFATEWKLHSPLTPDQLQYAGRTAKVLQVMFYHGGDELYIIDGIPGIWHEPCLSANDAPDDRSLE